MHRHRPALALLAALALISLARRAAPTGAQVAPAQLFLPALANPAAPRPVIIFEVALADLSNPDEYHTELRRHHLPALHRAAP